MAALDALGLPELADDLDRVETELRRAAASSDAFLTEVALHLIEAGGKRLRPALVVCAAYAVTARRPARAPAVTGAVAVELVHLGSLYHDDVIDEADRRRGVPSVNARWSNVVAILAGDYLLARASELASSLGAEVAGLLAATIGELCRGQVVELQHLFDPGRSAQRYFEAIGGKTAALFGTACRIGGMVSGAPLPVLDALARFGTHLGTCFQIVDDCLDVTGTQASLGKPAGNDLIEGVYTLPVILALTRRPELSDRLGRALEPEEADDLRQAALEAGGVDDALAVAREEARRADKVLAEAEGLDPEVTAGLRRLVDDLVTRRS
jgi:heptaprenyl diphosphate synthase